MPPVTYTLKSRLPLITAQAAARAPEIVEKTAYDIQAGCQVRSRVETGQMKGGWTAEMLSLLEWVVYNPVEHTIYNEFGTVNMEPQPMLIPSVEEAKDGFIDALAQLYG